MLLLVVYVECVMECSVCYYWYNTWNASWNVQCVIIGTIRGTRHGMFSVLLLV